MRDFAFAIVTIICSLVFLAEDSGKKKRPTLKTAKDNLNLRAKGTWDHDSQ